MYILSAFKTLLLTIIFLVCLTANSYATSPVFNKRFTFYAEKQELSFVLTQFARFQGYKVSISPAVIGELSGRFDDMLPSEFLQGMQSAFGVDWYRIDDTIFFYNENENNRVFISPRAMTAERMYEMLVSASVVAAELMPALGLDENMLTISGPPHYIEQITQAAISFEHAQTSNYVMKVFPLKHAWADDITLTSMDQDITVPGVASILRSMVLGITSSPSRVVQKQASVPSLRGSGLASTGQTDEAEEEKKASQDKQNASLDELPPVNIMADPRVNAVVINDAAYRMPYYEKVIEDLDKPVELVEIHAAIVDINSDFSRDLGVDFQGNVVSDHVSGSGDISFGGEQSTVTPNPPLGTLSGAGLSLSTIYTFGADFFLAQINALEQNGDARVLGRPSVLTVDNVQASLENTSTYYVQIQGTETAQGDLFKVEAGTVLRVTPHIIKGDNGNTSIKLAVNVQDNQNDSAEATPAAGALPPIKQTKINTQAIVNEGQSLLIGGYYYEQVQEGESGVPILKNVPLFGNLFKTKSKINRQMERLILITPRIIRYNETPTLPDHIDDKSFSRSPTQDNYERRKPQRSGAGCSKNKDQEDYYSR